MNYVVKDDNPDVGFTVEVGDVTDSEGNLLPDSAVTIEATSSDTNVLAITAWDPAALTGTLHIGAPGNAAFSIVAKTVSGDKILASGGDNFTVTVGDPAAVSSISTKFDGLTPVDETPAPPVVDNTLPVEPAPEPPVVDNTLPDTPEVAPTEG